MSETRLDGTKAQSLIKAKGLKQSWVIAQMGLRPTTGAFMVREGILPKDPDVAERALKVLAQILGVEAKSLLLRLPSRRTA